MKNIHEFSNHILSLKKQAKLEDDLKKLNINIQENTQTIVKGINLLRLGNNPVKITGEDIIKIISK